MRPIRPSGALSASVSRLYAASLLCVLYLFLPYGGYTRMMEGKFHCFLALSVGYLLSELCVLPKSRGTLAAEDACAVFFLLWSALSALFSPYGAAVLLGGPRRDGLATLALYVLGYLVLSRTLRPDRSLLALTAIASILGAILTELQLLGHNPLRLYPDALGYHDGDRAYAGFFAGPSGNADFTAFLFALALCVLMTACLRLRMPVLALAAAILFAVLLQLPVAAAFLGLTAALLWSPALLLPRRRRLLLPLSLLLSAAALLLLWGYDGPSQTLREASQLLRGEADGSFGSGRLFIWRQLLPLIRERPLLGGGPGTLFLRELAPFTWLSPDGPIPSDITAAHNEYLHILTEQGAPALASYVALLGLSIVRCFRRAEDSVCAIAGTGLLCYAAMAAVSVSCCITAPYVWLLLALSRRGGEADGL